MPVAIKYTGPKPYTDHLYGSRLHWEIGDTREDVPEHIAVKLLRHPEFEDARKRKTEIKVEPPPREEREDVPPLVNLDAMTRDQLADYAHRNFGVRLDPKAKKAELVDTVRLTMGKRVR
ncbi:hypothetical protein [Thauera aromatica]|uniref:hypothetical protein n=1 Tax=Thauera aromatica TaxID=59405 RepID=UPI001FFD4762|nr:hypothetical protein [Thauera aromatica]MCK2097524.1 hypothetical protein [Thauera aromatica]